MLPSACWLRVISGARIRALGMKRKPRCREGEETGECAAELEVMVMLLVVVITMFCSSSAPLSLTHAHTRTHTLSLFLSHFPSPSPSRQRVWKKSSRTHQKPRFSPAAAIASPDDIMLTSPLGQCEGREGADSGGGGWGEVERKKIISTPRRVVGNSLLPVPAWKGKRAYWWRSAAMVRHGAPGLLPNWAGGHMSVRPLPYLD